MRTLRVLAWAGIAPALAAASLAAQGWEPDRRLTRNDAASQTSINFARSIAADARGRVHVAWADERDGNREIYYQRSIDGGVSWGPPARLTVDSAFSNNPSIGAQGDALHLAWWDTRNGGHQIYYKRSLNGGATWETDRQVVASPGGGAHPSLAVAGDRVHIAYVDGRDGQSEVYYARSLDRGATWAVPVRLSLLPWNSFTPTVAASGQDVYVAWTDTRDAMTVEGFEEEYFRHSRDGGATWEAEVRLTSDPASSWAPSLAADGSDVWVAWFDDRGGDWEIYLKRSTDRGATWSADRRLTHSAGASLRPSLARRGSALHVVFWDTRDANEEVYWLTSPDRGATWDDPVRLTDDTSGSLLPSVAAAASGVHVVWTDGRSGNSEIYYKRMPGDPVAVGNGRIAFTRSLAGRPQIFTVDASGGDERQLTAEGANEYPAWSRDGSRLAFASDRSGDWEIWVVDADGSNQTSLTGAATPGADFVPDWSQDGTRVAFTSNHEELGHPEIWVINTDGRGATRLTFGPAGPHGSVHPSWSAGDERIYYAHDAGDGPQIWGMFPDGRGQERKTAGLGPGYPHANVPEFWRGAERLVFWAGMEQQFGEVWSWDFADPAGPRRLTDTPDPRNSDNPAWSPDGTRILFDTNRSGTEVAIWVMEADGSGSRRLISGAGQTSWQPVTADDDGDGFSCEESEYVLCVNDGRFRVETLWQTPQGELGAGHAVRLNDDSGYFWFFSSNNIELVIKTLDACGVNDHYWFFAGGLTNVEVRVTVTDTVTGAVKEYVNPQSTPFQPVQDTSAFAACSAPAMPGDRNRTDAAPDGRWPEAGAPSSPGAEPEAYASTEMPPQEALAPCVPSSTAMCLNAGRFMVEATWQTATGATGPGRAIQLTEDSGYFWFFTPSNVELVVKTLDGCGVNSRHWVFAGGLTNVRVELKVTDTQTGAVKTYVNPLNTAFQPIQDTDAFPTCPLSGPPIGVSGGLIALTLRDQNGKLQIFTITPDGTNKKQLTFEGENGRPDWSPDGRRITFNSTRNEGIWVAVMDADGSNQRLLIEGAAPDWSPDGKQIAFSRPDPPGVEIWVINADGSGQMQITRSGTAKVGPSWSPDGREMAFILINNPVSPTDPQPEIGIMNSDGTNERILTSADRVNIRANPDGSTTVCETANNANAPAWSPVDNRITFWSGIENQYGQVWVINSDGTESKQLTEDCTHRNSDDPSWSPDGKKILFSTGRSGRNELWVMDADGSNEKRLSDIDAGPFPGRATWQLAATSNSGKPR